MKVKQSAIKFQCTRCHGTSWLSVDLNQTYDRWYVTWVLKKVYTCNKIMYVKTHKLNFKHILQTTYELLKTQIKYSEPSMCQNDDSYTVHCGWTYDCITWLD